LQEQIALLSKQVLAVDRNVKCLTLQEGAGLCLQAMVDKNFSDFAKLKSDQI